MARILLAEPDRAIREFIAGILAEFGHDVQMCENAVDANVWLATAQIDALVTDMVLQGDHGLALSCLSAALGIPTVTLAGSEFHAEGSPQNAPKSLLEKPFRFSDLRRVLDAVEALRPTRPSREDISSNAA